MKRGEPIIVLPSPCDGVIKIDLPDRAWFGTMRLGDEEIKVYLSKVNQETTYDTCRTMDGELVKKIYTTRKFTIVEAK